MDSVMLVPAEWFQFSDRLTYSQVWGWIIAMIFIQCVAMSMAELCSSMPTSVSRYQLYVLIAGGSVLRFGGSCSSRVGPIGRLAYGLVKLYRSSHGSSFCQLWYNQINLKADIQLSLL